MDMGLSGKLALVTGSSSGLGRAIVESLAAVVFPASIHSGYVSGADLRVDGGAIRSVA
ncbi:hypothetical protein MI170_16245 [Mycolicibacterium goodii]|uniref:hypothetical protein n=1 Tax=Mycolicibacterium goodii TaxID=134601 RepID=UPI001F048F10|nr:hypothetical protein [Mycolicibacterium goodii]ULN44944.1 hypothetical protein MI170_16245 [Mycolicibacterium goodii]